MEFGSNEDKNYKHRREGMQFVLFGYCTPVSSNFSHSDMIQEMRVGRFSGVMLKIQALSHQINDFQEV